MGSSDESQRFTNDGRNESEPADTATERNSASSSDEENDVDQIHELRETSRHGNDNVHTRRLSDFTGHSTFNGGGHNRHHSDGAFLFGTPTHGPSRPSHARHISDGLYAKSSPGGYHNRNTSDGSCLFSKPTANANYNREPRDHRRHPSDGSCLFPGSTSGYHSRHTSDGSRLFVPAYDNGGHFRHTSNHSNLFIVPTSSNEWPSSPGGDRSSHSNTEEVSDDMESGYIETPEERKRRAPPKLVRQDSVRQLRCRSQYDWKRFFRARTFTDIFHWLAHGFAPDVTKSNKEVLEDLVKLAKLLKMLREYYARFGMPDEGGPKDQEYVLRSLISELYAAGCPVWALEGVMQQCSEGLTGNQGVDFFILPRKAFIFAPLSGATVMFRIKRGFGMRRLNDMESVAVRLASFASNTETVASIPSRFPSPAELRKARQDESVILPERLSKSELASEILELASEAQGLFYYVNSNENELARIVKQQRGDLHEFWRVDEHIGELFSRLAAIEAMQTMNALNEDNKSRYPRFVQHMFTLCTSAGAAAIWFGGGWLDILFAGFLGVLVSLVGATASKHSKDGRIISEVCSSYAVGFAAGVVALWWPEHTCFGAMAVSGIIDILQGFPIVFAVIELMGKHSVTGGAHFLEAMLFNSLIAVFLKFGQYTSIYVMGRFIERPTFSLCSNGISNSWYYLFVPLTAIGWSGMFDPHLRDLPIMASHGLIAYLVSFGISQTGASPNANYFVAATSVTLAAGVTSRFTGRNALANSIAGLYVLLPGSYLMNEVYSVDNDEAATNGFLEKIILRCILIGIGAWTGSLLCSHTVLGSTRRMLQSFTKRGKRDDFAQSGAPAKADLLYF